MQKILHLVLGDAFHDGWQWSNLDVLGAWFKDKWENTKLQKLTVNCDLGNALAG